MVVRNPYTRAISEFHCKWGGVGHQASSYNRTGFNAYVRAAIKRNAWKHHSTGAVAEAFHWNVQSLYIDDMIPIRVLRFENLDREFDDLMRSYHMRVYLGWANTAAEQRRRTTAEKGQHRFTTAHFDENTIRLIQDTYRIDFLRWGYSMEPPPPPKDRGGPSVGRAPAI